MWGFCFWLMPADASSTLQNSRGEDVALLVTGVLSQGFYGNIQRSKIIACESGLMFKVLFGLDSPASGTVPVPLKKIDNQMMVSILCNAASMMPFTKPEAKIAAGYMSLCVYREREVIIEEGSRTNLDFMVWVLDGEATLESFAGGGASQPVTVNVLSAGSAVGIMSLVDSEPRSLRVVASMPMVCAMLTRTQLQKLCHEQPQIGIKLMATLCFVFSQTLRSLTTKFKCHVRLNNVLNAELQGQESAFFQLDERL